MFMRAKREHAMVSALVELSNLAAAARLRPAKNRHNGPERVCPFTGFRGQRTDPACLASDRSRLPNSGCTTPRIWGSCWRKVSECGSRISGSGGSMTAARWLFLAPFMWLALMYVVHPHNFAKAVVGWAVIFAPFYLAGAVAEACAQSPECRKYRSLRGRGVTS